MYELNDENYFTLFIDKEIRRELKCFDFKN